MAENSAIEWTTHTFNPWEGCTKISPGCAHCYAEARANRYGSSKWGSQGTRVVRSEAYWREPVKWNKTAACQCGGGFRGKHAMYCPQVDRPRVFSASLADVFEDWRGVMHDSSGNRLRRGEGLIGGTTRSKHWYSESPCDDHPAPLVTMGKVRQRLFDLIDATPNLDWLIVTKRPENIARMIRATYPPDLTEGADDTTPFIRPNVWLLTSVENQEAADRRIPELLKVPAVVRGLSMEPLLGPVDLEPFVWSWESFPGAVGSLDWVIAGGESGHGARPMDPAWAQALRDQCVAAGVPFFFKQWGEYLHTHPSELHLSPGPLLHLGNVMLHRIGKKAAGRLLDGRTWDEFPAPAGAP